MWVTIVVVAAVCCCVPTHTHTRTHSQTQIDIHPHTHTIIEKNKWFTFVLWNFIYRKNLNIFHVSFAACSATAVTAASISVSIPVFAALCLAASRWQMEAKRTDVTRWKLSAISEAFLFIEYFFVSVSQRFSIIFQVFHFVGREYCLNDAVIVCLMCYVMK